MTFNFFLGYECLFHECNNAISNGENISDLVAPKEVIEKPRVVEQEEDNTDYSKMSDQDVEDEIERLLKVRKEEDKKRRENSGVTPSPSVSVSKVVIEKGNEL